VTTEQTIALIAALGIGTIARELITGLARWVTGKQDRERSAYRALIADADRAHAAVDTERARADHEASYRRRATEHAHALRRQLLDLGVAPNDIPPFPSSTTPSKETS
jgi:hypothetical protein